jgi:hemoglobin
MRVALADRRGERVRTGPWSSFAAALFAACAVLAGCVSVSNVAQPAPDPRVFQALGGESGIERIVDGLLIAISEDPRISHHFADTNILRLREKLIEQICAESGGPCVYTGDSMQASHAGHGFTDADFNALVECLQRSMHAQSVPFAAQNRLLQRLAPMRRDITYR